jgi:hypothetical protein
MTKLEVEKIALEIEHRLNLDVSNPFYRLVDYDEHMIVFDYPYYYDNYKISEYLQLEEDILEELAQLAFSLGFTGLFFIGELAIHKK